MARRTESAPIFQAVSGIVRFWRVLGVAVGLCAAWLAGEVAADANARLDASHAGSEWAGPPVPHADWKRFEARCRSLALGDDPRVWLEAPWGDRCRAGSERGRVALLARHFPDVDGQAFEDLLTQWNMRWRRVRDSYLHPIAAPQPASWAVRTSLPGMAWLRGGVEQRIAWLSIGDLDAQWPAEQVNAYLDPLRSARVLLVDLREATGQRGAAVGAVKRWLLAQRSRIIVLQPQALHGPPEALALTLATQVDATVIGQVSRGFAGATRGRVLEPGWTLELPIDAPTTPLQPQHVARGFSLEDIERGVDDMLETALRVSNELTDQNRRQPLELRRPVR